MGGWGETERRCQLLAAAAETMVEKSGRKKGGGGGVEQWAMKKVLQDGWRLEGGRQARVGERGKKKGEKKGRRRFPSSQQKKNSAVGKT